MTTTSRNLSLDRARTFLTLVVLLHHAVIPYTYFGHTDRAFSIGLDLIVLATDSFFMAMFFFLSGLFVWPALARKRPFVYLRERLLRIGIPAAIGALVLIPIAYYSLALRETPELTFSTFWWKTVTVGPWPSGPIWFLWVLLAFDLLASALYLISPTIVFPINRITPLWLFLIVVTEIVYVPPMMYFGTSHWLEFGPIVVQTSRILFYASYFFIGAGVGCAHLSTGVLSTDGPLPKRRWKWLSATLIFYTLMWFMIFVKRKILGNPPELPWWYHFSYGTFFVLFSAAILFAIFAFFLHAKSLQRNFLDRMQGEAYGMFLVHYPIVLWIQYFLYDQDWPALAKATTAFLLTVILSWLVTITLRRIPSVKRVL